MRTAIVAAFLALLAAAGAADPAPPVPDTHKPLQGLWKPESIVFDGAEMLPSPEVKAGLALVIKGTEYRAYFCTDAAKGMYRRLFMAELSLDPAAKTFELVVKEGQKAGEKRHGVYELTGSTLKLCYGPADRPRPAGFDAGKGSGVFCETWKLEKR